MGDVPYHLKYALKVTHPSEKLCFLPIEAAMLARSWDCNFDYMLCDETKEHTVDILIPHETAINLVF